MHRIVAASSAPGEIGRPRGRGRPRAATLVYHRIAPDDCVPFGNRVTPEHFAEHLEVLRDGYEVVPLRAIVDPHERARLPDRAVAITFDGYADNLHTAYRLLE